MIIHEATYNVNAGEFNYNSFEVELKDSVYEGSCISIPPESLDKLQEADDTLYVYSSSSQVVEDLMAEIYRQEQYKLQARMHKIKSSLQQFMENLGI